VKISKRKFFAVFVLLSSAAVANAAPLVNLQLLAKPSGSGSFTSSVQAAPGTTLEFEVVAQFAAAGTTNTNTAKSPNGTQDSINSLPIFSLKDADGGKFLTSALNPTFAQGNGQSSGTGLNTNTLSGIRVIGANGVYTNADSQQVLLTGTFQVGDLTTGLSFVPDTTSSGGLKIAGTAATAIVGINSTTETSADPMLSYANVSIAAAPEPGSLAFVGVLASTLFVRRRRAI
jgi:hypothetical protein